MKHVEERIWPDAPRPDGASQTVAVNAAPGLGLTPDRGVLKDTRVGDA